jgi:DNA-binding transcriptional regulator YiaG
MDTATIPGALTQQLADGDVAGALDTLMELLAHANAPQFVLVRETFALARMIFAADQHGEKTSPEALGAIDLLQQLAKAPVAAEGFRMLRESFGITQREIGERCGVHGHTVQSWECGKAELPPEAIVALLRLAVEHLYVAAEPLSGTDLRKLRRLLKLSQRQFAKQLGVSTIALAKWEAAGSKPLMPATVRRIRPRVNELRASAPAAA